MARRPSPTAVRIRAEVLRLLGLIPPGHFTTYGALAVHMNVAPLFVASVLARLSDEESAALPWAGNGVRGMAREWGQCATA